MVSFFMSLSFQIPSLLFQPGVSEKEIKDQIRVLKNEQLGIKIEVGVGRVRELSFSAFSRLYVLQDFKTPSFSCFKG